MLYRTLGRTGLRVSVVSFGAGPVSGLMTGSDHAAQRATVAAAIEAGVNWFDTAPGYGQGASEANLGRVLSELDASSTVHVATKVRIPPECSEPVSDFIRRSVAESLGRLRLPQVTLLQLHNGLTTRRNDEPASIAPADVLDSNGVAAAFRRLQKDGLVRFLGLTGTGHPELLRKVIQSGEFDAIQAPYNVLNPSAGSPVGGSASDTDYGNIFADCAAARMGVFAIRVYAGGALLARPPSAHTLKTPYFPLALYEGDARRAGGIQEVVAARFSMPELAVRFVLAHPAVTSAIIGLGSPDELRAIAGIPFDEPIPAEILRAVQAAK